MRKPPFAQHHPGNARNRQRDFLSLGKEIEMGTHICYPNVNFRARHVVTVIRLNRRGIRYSGEMEGSLGAELRNRITQKPGGSNLLIWPKEGSCVLKRMLESSRKFSNSLVTTLSWFKLQWILSLSWEHWA